MIRIHKKPLSVNRCWQGRRFKTAEYTAYEKEMLELLVEDIDIPEDGDLFVLYRWGLANPRFDLDNPVKPLQDILQKRYNFNDSRIRSMLVEKVKTPKGEEFIEFWIAPMDSIELTLEVTGE